MPATARLQLEGMYALAHFLHHDPEVVLTVTLAAADRLTLLQRQLAPPVRRLPDAWLPQYCVYLALDTHERAYEHPRPGEPSRERPTLDDYLVRYIKCLVWWTLDRPACHVAVALGCFLLRYQAGDPVQLVPVVCSLPPAQRIRRQLARQLQSRFPHAQLFPGDHGSGRMRPPTLHERALVQGALAMFTPWGISHVAPPPLAGSLLESHFSRASLRSDGDRIHALINPVDVGLPRLIREFNQQFALGSARRLQDSDAMLAVPRFTR